MAIDFSIVYRNPTVDKNGSYFTQISDIQFESIEGYSHPRILVQVKIVSMPRYPNDVFSAIIYETPDYDYLYRRFLQSFHLTDRKLTQAIDAQGYVFFGRMEHNGTAYSQLDFGSKTFLEKRLFNSFKIQYLQQFIDANLSNG